LYYLIYCDIISLLRSQQKILYEQGGSKMRKLNEKFTELTEMELIKTSGGGIWDYIVNFFIGAADSVPPVPVIGTTEAAAGATVRAIEMKKYNNEIDKWGKIALGEDFRNY
jgi:hypothetical protein